MPVDRRFTAARQRASRLAQGVVPLDPGLRAAGAQGAREKCQLAGGLSPLGNRPRGSRVWYGSLPVGKLIPPFGDRPHGSHKGQCPLTPHRAKGRGAARKTCSLAGELPPLGDRPRGSQVWCGSLPVGKLIPPFGDEPHGSLKKASVDLKSRWSFALQNYTRHIETSQSARGKPAPHQLRGSRAAIGSGGKKARPF